MAKPEPAKLARTLLEERGPTFAREAGIRVKDAPRPLFQLLVLSLLSSARIKSQIALEATRSLFAAGLTTPQRMADATWSRRTKILNEAGYARYDERTSKMLYETSTRLLEEYDGDLRALREEAGRDPKEERKRLKRFKGIGDVGVDIFFREAQLVWDELFPFIDKRAQGAVREVGLPSSPKRLQELVDEEELPALLDAALKVSLGGGAGEIRTHARGA